MKAKVIAEPYGALPCALQTFTINGIDADENDFGEGFDADWENAPDYGCGFHKFEGDRTEKPSVLAKYNIDYSDYLEICDLLEETLLVGSCGWCI
jgi:hypothetical protein